MSLIKLQKYLGVNGIRNFYMQIFRAMDVDSEVVIDFSEVKGTDLSVIHVIMLASIVAKARKKVLKLRYMPESIRKELQLTGL